MPYLWRAYWLLADALEWLWYTMGWFWGIGIALVVGIAFGRYYQWQFGECADCWTCEYRYKWNADVDAESFANEVEEYSRR